MAVNWNVFPCSSRDHPPWRSNGDMSGCPDGGETSAISPSGPHFFGDGDGGAKVKDIGSLGSHLGFRGRLFGLFIVPTFPLGNAEQILEWRDRRSRRADECSDWARRAAFAVLKMFSHSHAPVWESTCPEAPASVPLCFWRPPHSSPRSHGDESPYSEQQNPFDKQASILIILWLKKGCLLAYAGANCGNLFN